jgi:G3E family GTPase
MTGDHWRYRSDDEVEQWRSRDPITLLRDRLLDEEGPDVIYIETTGVAHPLEVVEACTDPVLADRLTISAVITVVDVNRWHERHKLNKKLQKLLTEQVKFADMLLLNKTDTLPSAERNTVEREIRHLNERAPLSFTKYSRFDSTMIENQKHTDEERHHGDCLSHHHHDHEHNHELDHDHHNHGHGHHVHHHLHVRTVIIPLERPMDRIAFHHWLRAVPGTLYRAKGFVRLTESPGLFVMHYSFGEPTFIRYTGNRSFEPILVFIGEDLDESLLKRELEELSQVAVHD